MNPNSVQAMVAALQGGGPASAGSSPYSAAPLNNDQNSSLGFPTSTAQGSSLGMPQDNSMQALMSAIPNGMPPGMSPQGSAPSGNNYPGTMF